MPSTRQMLPLAAVVSLLLCLPAAATDDRGFEIGFSAGFFQVDRDLAGPDGRKQEPTLGIRGGYVFDDRWGVSLDAHYANFDTDTFRGDTKALSARAAAEFTFTPYRDSQWFVSAGPGYWDLGFDNALDYSSYYLSVGAGQQISMGARHHVRWEFRVGHSLADDGLTAFDLSTSDVTQAEFLVGFSFGLGGPVLGDRRAVRVDPVEPPEATPVASEPVTPPPAAPEATETPRPPTADVPMRDTDNDGVTDDVDGCPATFKGIDVGPDGCPLDEDKDGVYDGLGMDKCLNTPPGAKVDTRGCALDGDADGVRDGLDRCPGSAAGAKVDANGCP